MKFLLLCLSLFALAPNGFAQSGRFQLASGEFVASKGRMPVVLKIDTETGDTWVLTALGTATGGGQVADTWGWVPLEKDAVAAWQRFQQKIAPEKGVPGASPVAPKGSAPKVFAPTTAAPVPDSPSPKKKR